MKTRVYQFVKAAALSLQDEMGVRFELPDIIIEHPKRREYGDFSTNLAMVAAPLFKTSPLEIAKGIIARKNNIPCGFIERFEIAGPGFINFFIERNCWYELLKEVYLKGADYGKSKMGRGAEVQVEFVSANPTGPLHVGHGRGAVVGDVLARILSFAGYSVSKEYYINDVGNQMNLLGSSVYARYMNVFGKDVVFPDNGYRGDYILDIAKEIAEKEGGRFASLPAEEALPFFIEYASGSILKGIELDLKDFGVTFDRWFSEKELFKGGKVEKTIDKMRSKGLIYEKDGALWFKTTLFGDDKDRVLKKADGSTTYFASDIAYHEDKLERGFERIIDVWGADHHGYKPRIEAFIKAHGEDGKKLDVVLVQLVSLLRGGEKVSMSTRAGEFVTLRDVIDEVGSDAARFFFLLRKSDAQLEFDLELAKKQTPENPVFYVQYAYARICSIFSVAEQRGIAVPSFDEADLALLSLDEEIELIKSITMYPEMIESCAAGLAPHHLVFYLQELVSLFHSYYNKNRVVSEQPEEMPLTLARLFMCGALKTVIKNALGVLGITAPEKM